MWTIPLPPLPPPPVHVETAAALGFDPDAPPVLPEMPHWFEVADRLLIDDDTTDTATIPVVTEEVSA